LPEIGVAPIDTMTAADQLADVLAPSIAAMHCHGEVMTLPNGAVWLARSAQTDVQAFRVGRCALGLLFHLEVDDVLLEQWLAEPVMVAEAQAALGARYASQLRGDAQQLEPARARKVFDAFAAHCTTRLTA
jgi:GMP synthase (glutamine-hydrolysing)